MAVSFLPLVADNKVAHSRHSTIGPRKLQNSLVLEGAQDDHGTPSYGAVGGVAAPHVLDLCHVCNKHLPVETKSPFCQSGLVLRQESKRNCRSCNLVRGQCISATIFVCFLLVHPPHDLTNGVTERTELGKI